MQTIARCLTLFALITTQLGSPAVAQTAESRASKFELQRAYEAWSKIQEPEEKLRRGDRLLTRSIPRGGRRLSAQKTIGQLAFDLGDLYFSREVGSKVNNIEKAIERYHQALRYFQQRDRRRYRGWVQNSLGFAYRDRIRGARADNVEKAISHYQAALAVFTRSAFPQDWAQTENNLGLAHVDRIRGDRADNIERAITHYEAALTVRTREAYPHDWALTRNNLGFAYRDRIQGERADNVEKAISHYQAALAVFTRGAFPQDWAQTENNLGLVHVDRIRGDRADNIERALAHYEAALTIRTREAYPHDWALTQNNLGFAYRDRIRGERADNVDKAISHYQAALTVFTRDAFPRDWAQSENNLGLVHVDRIRGDRADNIDRAINHYEAALTVRTREAYPHDWALTQNNLGFAHRDRIRGERADNVEKAISHYQAALTVFTRDAFPRDHLRTGVTLGTLLSKHGKWLEAGQAYAGSRDAFLVLFGEGIDETEARQVVSEAGSLFSEAAFASAKRGELELAFALATEGRARLLSVALKLNQLQLSPERRRAFDELRAGIRVDQRLVYASQGAERGAALDRLGAKRRELLALIDTGRASSDARSPVVQARALVQGGGAVVVPVITKVGSIVLIVSHGSPEIRAVDLVGLNAAQLDDLLRGDAKSERLTGWLGSYSVHHISDPGERDARWGEWIAAIDRLGPALWQLGLADLDKTLKGLGLEAGARLIWLPTGALGILPLALAQDPTSQRRFADDYEIVYAPSLEALVSSAQRAAPENTGSTLAVVYNPTGDLPGTENEGFLVASYFEQDARTSLTGSAAVPERVLSALRGRTYWHFASHGRFSWKDVRSSALLLHSGMPLSVGQLQETDGLGRPRLVVLSACETGLYDIDHSPDEFIGLPSAFIALGASGVVATLWPVSDDATGLLMAKLYDLIMQEHFSPPSALAAAQSWLRGATNVDLVAYAKEAKIGGRLKESHLAEIERALSTDGLKRSRNHSLVQWAPPSQANDKSSEGSNAVEQLARPYSHPYFWAGFTYSGL